MRAIVLALLVGCAAGGDSSTTVTISASALGDEGKVLRLQLARFMAQHPEIRVEIHPTPDGADQRHQLYVQWLNAGARDPDVIQVDVVWTAELAAAGWILPLDRFAPDTRAFFPAAVRADSWNGVLYALPWFVDVGMLYYRTDLVPRAPATMDELLSFAAEAQRAHGVDGFVWQGARYEGLVCNFLEHLGASGGTILDDTNAAAAVASPAGRAALGRMRRLLDEGLSPRDTLTWTEEHVRFRFQNGRAAFMRNWPYALALLEDPAGSRVAGKVGIAPMPAGAGGRPTAALGGAQLAINARSEVPEAAWRVIAFLTAAEQMRERAAIAGQYPARPALYDDESLAPALRASPARIRRIIEAAEARPVTPVYAELSERLQIELHRALSGQVAPDAALAAAQAGMTDVLAVLGRRPDPGGAAGTVVAVLLLLTAVAAAIAAARALRRQRSREARTAWAFVAPALVTVAAVAIFPLAWTVWESLHAHDLRLSWTGRPFVGLGNYLEAFSDARFRAAVAQTLFFTITTLLLELSLGLALALGLDRMVRARGLVRAAVLLPWALPTVVAALVFRFLFEGQGAWFAGATSAWVPVILADVWKTTPFVALLLLAGLQSIDPALHEAARIDGAGSWARLRHVTLPLLAPTIVVAALFRALDAFRVFDLVYVLTGGGPGTATESLALYTFSTLLSSLRFGYGAALSVLVFAGAFLLALLFVRVLGAGLDRGDP